MQDKVKFPALGLIILGALGALAQLFSLVSGGIDPDALDQFKIPEEQKETLIKALSGGGIVLPIIGLALDAFVLWSGLQMLKLKSWTAAVVANVLVMIPCFTSCCCIIGVPLGIWGLIVLMKPEVKQAFQGASPA